MSSQLRQKLALSEETVTNTSTTELIDNEHLDAAIRNAARHNTAENSQGRNRLTPYHEQEYAPWTDMPKVIETLKSNKQS